jgi:hypothetical protein
MANIDLGNWDIHGNELYSRFNNFELCINMLSFNREITDEDSFISFEPGDIGFLLIVYDLNMKKRTFCAFTSFEEVLFFINSYLITCEDIMDVNTKYYSYRISNDAISNKGYLS